ncbi:DUF6538 domain-containing protein [Phreatobacter oligotrophus]|uniref:DUF6538 domain-containing protein n=1 Tax=Phreatobacter oligotrophus TaxID=1122261 RepID=UPI00308111ED
MARMQHLTRRGQTWYAIKEVPRPLRDVVGKRRLLKSLQTHSLDEARRKIHSVIAEWEADWQQVRNEKRTLIRSVVAQALSDRRKLERSPEAVALREHLVEHAFELKDLYGPDVADRYYAIAIDGDVPVSEGRDRWLAEVRNDHTAQTVSQHEVAFRVLLDWTSDGQTVRALTRRKAGEFVERCLIPSGRATKTIKRYCSSLSSCWTWMISRGLATENPWTGLNIGLRSRNRIQRREGRQGLPDDKLIALLSMPPEGKYGDVLYDLVRMELCTGCRLDELCSLTTDDVWTDDDGLWFHIGKGKTEAATRDVPVHEWVAPIFLRRIEKPGLLFPNLVPGGRDDKLSAYVTKAYRTFRNNAGVRGRYEDFHALRSTFTEAMEGAGVPVSTVKLLVGHRRDDITFGRYSRGKRVDLRKAMDQLSYSPKVIELIQKPLPGSL